MKLLHDLRAHIEGLVVFYGEGTPPCPDGYHNGFGCERWRREAHNECARRLEVENPFPTGEATFWHDCRCPTCARQGEIVHLFPWPQHRVDELQHPPDAMFAVICPDCAADRHPTLGDGFQRPVVEWENIARDHREEDHEHIQQDTIDTYPHHIFPDGWEDRHDEEDPEEDEDPF